jgi:uncharacterized protein DUF2786
MNGSTNRAELLDKISALLQKTTDNGCTEAEAIAAAQLAEKLMAKYGLSLAELKAVDPVSACEQVYTELGNRRTHEAQYVVGAIAYFTDTKTWYQRHGWRIETKAPSVGVVFFGLSADVQIATYLFKTIRTAMDDEWRAYWKKESRWTNSNARTARKCFMQGMVERLSARIRQMKQAQQSRQAVGNDCHTLVVINEQVIETAFKATGTKLRRGNRWGFSFGSADAYYAGRFAGDRISIHSGELQN